MQQSERELLSVMEELKVAHQSLTEVCQQLAETEQNRDVLQCDNEALERELEHIRELYHQAIGDRNTIASRLAALLWS